MGEHFAGIVPVAAILSAFYSFTGWPLGALLWRAGLALWRRGRATLGGRLRRDRRRLAPRPR